MMTGIEMVRAELSPTFTKRRDGVYRELKIGEQWSVVTQSLANLINQAHNRRRPKPQQS